MSAREEFRITWKRRGKARRRRFYQTRAGAEEFLELLESSHPEEPPECGPESDPERWERMTAAFEEPPKLEVRAVGPWKPAGEND